MMNPLINSTSTTSKRSIWPEETRDLWVVGAGGSELELSNGKFYDDWCSALGASTLGYPRPDDYRPNHFSPATSLPWSIENEFAHEFCQAMNTEAVRFFKSGSDAVSCAVRLARGFTGHQHVIVFDKSYHGTGDWFGSNLWPPSNGYKGGIVDKQHLIACKFGEMLNLRLDAIAAIVVESVPKAIEIPPTEWLVELRRVCDEHGILLISDEVILGYRHSLRGYLDSAGVSADLYCYGKAMGQGAAISATTGRADVLGLLAKEVHFSGTNNGEPLPLQIAQWTLREYLEKDICFWLNDKGQFLRDILHENGFATNGLNSRFEVIFASPEAKNDCIAFCFQNAILFPGFCSMAVSHTAKQMERLIDTLKKWRDK